MEIPGTLKRGAASNRRDHGSGEGRIAMCITLWKMMTIVLLAESGVRWGFTLREQSQWYRTQAESHELQRRVGEIMARSPDFFNPARGRAEQKAHLESAAWHAKRRDLYLWASWLPWLSVAEEKEPVPVPYAPPKVEIPPEPEAEPT